MKKLILMAIMLVSLVNIKAQTTESRDRFCTFIEDVVYEDVYGIDVTYSEDIIMIILPITFFTELAQISYGDAKAMVDKEMLNSLADITITGLGIRAADLYRDQGFNYMILGMREGPLSYSKVTISDKCSFDKIYY
jgi:hypothetical protein